MYSNYQNMSNYSYPNYYGNEDERFFWAPFLFGGLAGTALGYGIANNNQIQHNQVPYYYQAYPMYPAYPVYPTYSSTNYYY